MNEKGKYVLQNIQTERSKMSFQMICNYKSHLKGASGEIRKEMGQQNDQPGQTEVKPISSKVPLYLHQTPETRGRMTFWH